MGMFDIKKVNSNGEVIIPEVVDNPPAQTPAPGQDTGLSKEEAKLRTKQLDAVMKISEGAVRIGTGIIEIVKIRAQGENEVSRIREQRISMLSAAKAEMEKNDREQENWEKRFDKNSRLFRETLVFLNQSNLSKEEGVAAMEVLKELFRK